MSYADLKKQQTFLMNKADSILKNAENAKRNLTESESTEVDACMAGVNALNPRIAAIEAKNTILKTFPNGVDLITASGGRKFQKPRTTHFTDQYAEDFFNFVGQGGKGAVGAALYEGSDGAGGYAVPITVDDQIVPLAPQEMGVRKLALVMPTSMDIKIPQKSSFGTATTVAELGTFGGSALTLNQITLSAFMAGSLELVSWELAQDVPAFQAFVVDDMILAQQMLEENLYVNGTGTGEAQGLIGNVGAGVTEEADGNGNLFTINGTLDLIGQLNAMYHPGASWLMSRPTSIVIRKAQQQSNLFFPAFTSVAGQDFLHGYPVEYSAYVPSATRGNCCALFGDFKRGYVIGDRGGSGINIKILDQPYATQGQIALLAYRRTDGRVRRSEAIQQYNVAQS